MSYGKGRAAVSKAARFLAFIIAAGGGLLPAVSVPAADGPGLAFVSPRDGATVAPGKVVVIGKVPVDGPANRVDIQVDDAVAKRGVEVKNGAFTAEIELQAGRSVLKVRYGGSEAVATFTVSAASTFASHKDLEKCSSCHSGKAWKISGPKDILCYRCHVRKDKGKFVHGPMGSGQCTACHDPHGSPFVKLTVASPEALCADCHDQKSEQKHMKETRGKGCVVCHDPHSSSKAFFVR